MPTGLHCKYDALNRITLEKNLYTNIKTCYNYDELSRVTERIVTNEVENSTNEENFTYDDAGNVIISNTNKNDTFVYDKNNRLTKYNTVDISYDHDGNMTTTYLSGCNVSLRYDSSNRLVSVGSNTYTYNVEDVRIRNLCDHEDTKYVYDTNTSLSRLLVKTTNGKITKYVYGAGLIGEECDGAFKTYHFDYRGSTAAIATNSDSTLFNPASVSLGMYGLNSKDYTADMYVYVVEGEPLNNLFGPISKPIDNFEYIYYDKGGVLEKHSMDAVISALQYGN